MDENINNVAPEANYEPSNESYSEPQQTYQDNYQEGTREPAQTNDGSPSTFAIRVDPRTGRKSIVSIGEEPEEQQPQPPVVEQPRVDYTTPFNVPPRPQPQQNVVSQQNVAPPQPAKYQNAGEVVSAMQNGTLDESRIPVEMAFQYAQYKQAQQQQVAEQTPTPDNTDEQLKYRQEYYQKVESMARENALKDVGLTEDDLAIAEYSDDAELQAKASMYNTALAMHRNMIVQNVNAERAKQVAAQQAQAQVVNRVNQKVNELSQTEPHFQEISNSMATFFKDKSIPFDDGVRYLLALNAYNSGNMTEKQEKDLLEYWDKARIAQYSKINGVGTQPRRSPYIETNTSNSSNYQTNDRQALLKQLRSATDYREKRRLIGLLSQQH